MIKEIAVTRAAAAASFKALNDAWKQTENKVFVMRAAEEITDPRAFYDAHFPYIGTPAELAEDVNAGGREEQRSGDIWFEVRFDPKHPDAYRHSANAQPLHTDGSYIPSFPNATLMTCVANAGKGGETTFVDGADIVAALKSEMPELLTALTSRLVPHARSGDRREEKVIEVKEDGVWVNWNYYCVDPEIDSGGRDLAEQFFSFLRTSPTVHDKTHAVKLNPGDAVTWKDRRILHGRNGFVANQESERFLWKCAIDVGNFGG